MRAILLSFTLCLGLFPAVLLSQQTAEPCQLLGIVSIPPLQLAAISLNDPRAQTYLLSASEREGPLEVLDIDPVLASARVRLHGTNEFEIRLKNDRNDGPVNLMFENLPADVFLTLYSKLSERTVLRPAALPGPSFTLRARAPGKAEAATILETALAEKGISAIRDGDHFAILITENLKGIVKPGAPSTKTTAPKSEILPAGTINFRSLDLSQAAPILAELKGQTLDRNGIEKMPALVSLHSQTALSKAEAIYAMETVFRLNGVKTVSDGNTLRLEYLSNH